MQNEMLNLMFNNRKAQTMEFKFGFPYIKAGDNNKKFLFGVSHQLHSYFIYFGFIRIKIRRKGHGDNDD